MLELMILVALAGAGVLLAVHAFTHPKGVYVRSLAGVVLTVFGAAALWHFFPPRSAEAGLGAFLLFAAVSALAIAAALVACASATARHAWDALRHNHA